MTALSLPEFDQEMKSTRRVLERVPGDKAEWRPHPKSFPLGHLAQLLSWMPGWITKAIRETRLDLARAGGYSFEKTETLLDLFDRNVREAREALANATESDLAVSWSLTSGDRVLMSMPRGDVIRQTISHLAHHRGQMTVYLRLCWTSRCLPSTVRPRTNGGSRWVQPQPMMCTP